jgi:hypothetical protein
LADYCDEDSTAGKESVYVGRSVPIAAGGSLMIPIQVSTPGSVVEYAVENKQYDFGFGITAEREEGITIVKVRQMNWGTRTRLEKDEPSSFCTVHHSMDSFLCLFNLVL